MSTGIAPGDTSGGGGVFGNVHGAVGTLGSSAFGHSHGVSPFGPKPNVVGGFRFPDIPIGANTTLMLVPFPVTTSGPPAATKAIEEIEVLGILGVAVFIWILPALCINQKCCCRCFKRFMSRRITCYFVTCLFLNGLLVGGVLAIEPDMSANDLFFRAVGIVGWITDNLENLLNQCALIAGIGVVLMFRNRIMMILGYDQQIIRADIKDCLTCFTMHRFSPVELSILKCDGLPGGGFGTRSLFIRVVCGYNEPCHTRPHDGCSVSFSAKERMQLNYDSEDQTQRLSIVVKQQEVVGGAVAQLAPVAGAVAGGVAGLMSIGPAAGAGLGAVTGIGAANSLGKEVARVDLSSTQINRLRDQARTEQGRESMSTGPIVPWKESHFQRVDLVPQGVAWIRIHDVENV
jgi:hypothetical protein